MTADEYINEQMDVEYSDFDSLDEVEVDELEVDETADLQFEGDAGTLEHRQRRALTALLKKPFLCEMTDPELYADLMENRNAVVSALHNLYIDLEINHKYKVAWAKPVEDNGRPLGFSLKTNRRLNRNLTVMVVMLRTKVLQAESEGEERWFVDRKDLETCLREGPYIDSRNGEALERALEKAIKDLISYGILKEASRAERRYQILPTLPAIITLEAARHMVESLKALGKETEDE